MKKKKILHIVIVPLLSFRSFDLVGEGLKEYCEIAKTRFA